MDNGKNYDKKCFTTLTPVANVIKPFTEVIYWHSITILSFCVIKLLSNGSYFPWHCFITLTSDKAIPFTVVIYGHILTLDKEVTMVNY
jgi:hypothetical protein